MPQFQVRIIYEKQYQEFRHVPNVPGPGTTIILRMAC